ncbi:MAG: TolC family protein [Planctomycetes bacterium]|nr:TolC family protein [Planctomycetota bacterium]
MTPRPLRSLSPFGLVLAAACSSAHYAADADREVADVLAEATTRTLGDRERNLLRPETEPLPTAEPVPAPGTTPTGEPPASAAPAAPPEPIDLRRALALATKQNRDFLSRREALYQSGLSIALTRFQFGPQFAAAVSYLWPRSENGGESHQLGTNWAVSQILPTGGNIALNTGVDASWPFGNGAGDPTYGTSASVTLSQPLLAGFGHDIAYEPLTAAERALTYAVRDFEEFRQGFSIRIAEQFFQLRSQKQTLANEDKNYDSAVFDRKRAEALVQVGRDSEQTVFLARRREIEAKDQLINARAAYERAVDDFKLQLGLPTTAAIEIADGEPPYDPVRFEVTSAVSAALHNRLDLITQRQQVEDSERQLKIAENALLPDLSLVASFGTAGNGNDLGHAPPDEWSSSVGLAMDIPLQRKSQRNSLRNAQIGLEQARRGLRLREEQIELDIRDAVRKLRSTEERIALQEDQIAQEQRAVTVTEIRYEAGDVTNRELLEARQALVDARNALIRLKVDHSIARLRLLQDMGVFFVDAEGMWR